MAVLDLFSKRRRREQRSGQAEVYRYDEISDALRVQIAHIWREHLGVVEDYGKKWVNRTWHEIHDAMSREKGVFALAPDGHADERCVEWFRKAEEVGDVLDMIELTFQRIETLDSHSDVGVYRPRDSIGEKARAAVAELNQRFLEHAVGFQYENGQIIRIDSQYVHSEVVKPALTLLAQPLFEKANEDFLTAHKHYREGRAKDCVVAAQRAFESTLKAICTKKSWPFQPGDRASELIALVRSKGLFPDFLDKGFDTYIAVLKTGLPGVRNNAGGHGESPGAPAVPGYIAAYALHLTAANIVLAVEAMKATG